MHKNTYFSKKSYFYFVLLGVILLWQNVVFAAQTYRFGVANAQTVMTSAAQWNPILAWIEKHTGISLTLQMGVVAENTQAKLIQGEYDFFFGYPFLQNEPRDKLDFRVLLKGRSIVNQSAIIVQANSPYFSLNDLTGETVWMSHVNAFIAHTMPVAMLRAKKIEVLPHLVANQEALVTAFKLGQVRAAAVNMKLFEKAMINQQASYRVLWRSSSLPSLPIGVQKSVPLGVVERVRDAFIAMADDPEGHHILHNINQRMGLGLTGWDAANDAEYQFAVDSYQLLSSQNQSNE